MSKVVSYFRTRSIRFIIVSSCIAIIALLVISHVIATFVNFQKSMSEAVNIQTRELSTQIVFNYENYISSVIKTSNIIQTNVDKYDLDSAAGAASFSGYLAEMVQENDDILKIAIYDYSTRICFASSKADEIGGIFKDEDTTWFYEANLDPTIHVFSVPYPENETGTYMMNVSKLFRSQERNFTGVLKIELSFQNFIDLIKKSNLGENGHITIVDPEYNVVYTSQPEGNDGGEIDVIKRIILGKENVNINGHVMAVNVETLANTKWRICVFINIDKISEIQNIFLTTLVLTSLVIAAVGAGLYLAVAQMITSPMKRLEMAMLKVEKSDYFRMEEVDIKASKEVEAMIRQFNKMMIKISELMERVVVEQSAQRKSELNALQSQINPHFLYNTLDSIIWLVENNKNREAGEMVVALSRLFRSSISKDSVTVPLRDEIEHVRNYLLIQKYRYADSFDYRLEVDEDALDCMTMKLILQPIVENCIYHGLKNKIDRGDIKITAKLDGDFLMLSVSDNGYGMRVETISKIYSSFESGDDNESVGLKNIYQRIMLYYGGNAEMRIESEPDEGTVITIKEPVCQ